MDYELVNRGRIRPSIDSVLDDESDGDALEDFPLIAGREVHHGPKRKLVFRIGLLSAAMMLVGILTSLSYSSVNSVQVEVVEAEPGESTTWVVITSINPPTPADFRVCTDPQLKGVVVGDTKSPANWSCGHCVFLSVADQRELGYSIVGKTPFKAYTRKNIGYLYAIAHGARTIFDTDDDNLVTGSEVAMLPQQAFKWGLIPGTDSTSVNVYSYFGRPDVWPRGFPLEHYSERESVRTIDSEGVVMIQQGLADLDPDVDAIYRLTRGTTLTKVRFISQLPATIPEGVFSPFNSQNTFFAYSALWGTVIPITTSFRVCDIWRGYFTQRLLWSIGGVVGFTGPTVDQIRNAHNYLADFVDEVQLYEDAGRLTVFLQSWVCPSDTLKGCIVSLATDMAAAKFWGKREANYYRAWVHDLDMVGYQWPALLRTRVAPAPVPRPTLRDATLIIAYNVPINNPTHLRFLKNMYQQQFHRIIFALPTLTGVHHEDHQTLNLVECLENPGGYFMYACLARVMEAYPTGESSPGYFFLADDALVDVAGLGHMDLARSWRQSPSGNAPPQNVNVTTTKKITEWPWWVRDIQDPRGFPAVSVGGDAIKKALKALDVREWQHDPTMCYPGWADIGFIARRHVPDFVKAAGIFRHFNVFSEIAWGTLINIVQNKHDGALPEEILHNESRLPYDIETFCCNIQKGRSDRCRTFHALKTGHLDDRPKLEYCYQGCSHLDNCVFDCSRHQEETISC